MTSFQKFTVRPFSKPGRSDLKDVLRIYLSPTALLSLKLRNGDPCSIAGGDSSRRTAVAWTASEKIQDTVVQTSKLMQDLYGFKLGDRVSLAKAEGPVPEAENVTLEELPNENPHVRSEEGTPTTERVHWEWFLEHPLSRAEFVCIGMSFEQVELKGQKKSFVVKGLSGESEFPVRDLFQFSRRSKVLLQDENSASDVASPRCFDLEKTMIGVGGLKQQIEQIKDRLQGFNSDAPDIIMPSYYHGNTGILLYGPKGTGKTVILNKIASGPWQKVFNINSSTLSGSQGNGEGELRRMFLTARRFQPSLIVIDQLEYLAPKRRFTDNLSSATLAPELCEGLDNLGHSQVHVIAATRHPNDVDETLRTPNRFGLEIELPVPSAVARKEILRAIRGSSDQPNDALLDYAAERTHGFVGADLFALLQTACRKGRARYICIGSDLRMNGDDMDGMKSTSRSMQPHQFEVNEGDLSEALTEIRPTAMREVFLETPKIRWSDIGGQYEIKQRLQKAVERPLKMAERMKRLNINSKKGILLYGPPGCSKTLLVKALATEAGLNFLAVKGAEMLSMYVGESERALREIFRKARSASPSIIFFDEIDAIASKRSEDGRNDGVNILTTLLNEMDGIEELGNVLVVAATNKPEALDPALMRPGRLDNLFYVGPPDLRARQEIFSLWTGKSSVTEEVDVKVLAERTDGYSGAEIVSICETAGEVALDEEENSGIEQQIDTRHFELALSKVKKQITAAVTRRYEKFGEG